MEKKKVLIGSPVRQKAAIFKEFLDALASLDCENLDVYYYFIDDNDSQETVELLRQFSENGRTILRKAEKAAQAYVCNEKTHYWNERLIWRVADFKNLIIQKALEDDFDYLFLADSDIVLHPRTIMQLIEAEKDIVSEIFWTSWQPGTAELPNVWLYDLYDMAARQRGEKLDQAAMDLRGKSFIAMLKQPGVYDVGGLGACTLISKRALRGGVSFSEIKNLTFWGEDRHFCVRANALGFDLYVDTHCPAYHIYRDDLLAGVEAYRNRSKGAKSTPQKVQY